MQLIKYEAARQALAAARSVDEVKDWADRAQALQAYARQANDSELERMAAEIRVRAKRRIGQLSDILETGHKVGQKTKVQGPASGKLKAEVLKDAGVSKSEAHRCEQLASVPEEAFEGYLAECRDEKRVASCDALTSRFIRQCKRFDELERLNGISEKDIDAVVGDYDVIVIDPPWPMQKIDRDARPNQAGFDYPTMSEEDLEQLQPPMAKSCHVWLWTTHKFLPMALRLLPKWGLAYICTFVWHKPGGFQPFNLPQYNAEFALYARKGSPLFTTLEAFNVCFTAPRGKHSEKPEAFYSLVRDHTAGRRLDLFARRKIAGFAGWGQEYDRGAVDQDDRLTSED